MAKVIIARGVFIVIREGYRGDNQVNAVVRHISYFLNTVVVIYRKVFAFDFHSFYSHRSHHTLADILIRQSVFFKNGDHFLCLLVIAFPLGHQRGEHLVLFVHVDDVDNHLLLLPEPVDTVDRLNKIVELIVDTAEYRTVTIPLKVTSRTGYTLLCCEALRPSLGKVYNVLLSNV